MKNPITLHIPEYYDQRVSDENSLKFLKTKSLLEGDNNNAMFLASIENIENYQCSIKEIPQKYLDIATNCFKRDIDKKWELPIIVDGCKVYTYYWDDIDCHFRIYWIIISEKHMLQLTGIFTPEYSGFYKLHFMSYFQATEIDKTFNFSKQENLERIFKIKKVPIDVNDLKERIEEQKQKEEKSLFLKENLKISNPNFYTVLETELKEKEEAIIENFICTDWNMFYDLANPENFSDPDSTIKWEDNSDVYTYYENPYTDNSKITITCYEDDFDSDLLKTLVENKEKTESNLVVFFEYYTFGNGGAYADAIHYQWAKIEIERLHNTTYTNQEFLKRNLCLTEIETIKSTNELKLRFACSWDTEHGIEIILNDKYECKTEQ